jgi:hypothetical protein
MTAQRTDAQVARDAARFNATYRKLQAELRAQGIRNVHTSRKAREAIARAAVRPSNLPLEEAIEMRANRG